MLTEVVLSSFASFLVPIIVKLLVDSNSHVSTYGSSFIRCSTPMRTVNELTDIHISTAILSVCNICLLNPRPREIVST